MPMKTAQVVGTAAAFLAGSGLAFQATMNGALARSYGQTPAGASTPTLDSMAASLTSFVCGITSLATVACFQLGQKRRPKAPGKVHWWMWLCGGAIGAFYVTMATIMGPLIGFSLFFVCVVAGQLVTSLAVDKFGAMDLKKKGVNRWKVGSVLVVLAGSLMAVVERLEVSSDVGLTVLYVLLSISGGVSIAAQVPVNSAFTIRFGTLPHRTALLSFSVGGVIVGALYGVMRAVAAADDEDVSLQFDQTEWWMYCGGFLGAAYVVSSVALAPVLGVAKFFLATVAGQLTTSLLIDSLGLLNSNDIPITALRVCGIVVVFLGAAAFRLLPLKAASNGKAADEGSSSEANTSSTEADFPAPDSAMPPSSSFRHDDTKPPAQVDQLAQVPPVTQHEGDVDLRVTPL